VAHSPAQGNHYQWEVGSNMGVSSVIGEAATLGWGHVRTALAQHRAAGGAGGRGHGHVCLAASESYG
jgi:hypothetical protein